MYSFLAHLTSVTSAHAGRHHFSVRLIICLIWHLGKESIAPNRASAPAESLEQIYSTNPLERLSKEVKRRSAVVGIFPCNASIVRLIGAVIMEQNDEWLLQDRYMPRESLERLTGSIKELAVA